MGKSLFGCYTLCRILAEPPINVKTVIYRQSTRYKLRIFGYQRITQAGNPAWERIPNTSDVKIPDVFINDSSVADGAVLPIGGSCNILVSSPRVRQ